MDWSNLTLRLEPETAAVVTMSLDEIEAVIGGGLPAWRRDSQAGWGESATHAHAWLQCGRIARLQKEDSLVDFEHIGPPGVRAIAPENVASLNMCLDLDLLTVGLVALDAQGRPDLLAHSLRGPGVYAFTLRWPGGAPAVCYVGESENLVDRMSAYQRSTSDASTGTNRKVHREIAQCIIDGGEAEVSAVLGVSVDGRPLDLGRASERRLAENALLVHLRRLEVRCLNVDDFVFEDTDD